MVCLQTSADLRFRAVCLSCSHASIPAQCLVFLCAAAVHLRGRARVQEAPHASSKRHTVMAKELLAMQKWFKTYCCAAVVEKSFSKQQQKTPQNKQ